MRSRWLFWSFIPGLHWLAWMQAGILAKYPWYYAIGFAYALPLLLFIVWKRLPFRLVLISWVLSMLHMQMQKYEINRRIAYAVSAGRAHDALMQALLRAALNHHGCLSVTQGVMETGKSFLEVERLLNQMVESGYVFTRNNPETGILEYVFKEWL